MDTNSALLIIAGLGVVIVNIITAWRIEGKTKDQNVKLDSIKDTSEKTEKLVNAAMNAEKHDKVVLLRLNARLTRTIAMASKKPEDVANADVSEKLADDADTAFSARLKEQSDEAERQKPGPPPPVKELTP